MRIPPPFSRLGASLSGRLALSWALLLLPPTAMAFRCNSYVIDPGLQKIEVLKKCGQPASQELGLERRILRVRVPAVPGSRAARELPVELEREVWVSVETWVYNFGPQQFMQQLVFEDGRLRSIQDLSYGF